MWVSRPFFAAISKLISHEMSTEGSENLFQMSNCVFCLMPDNDKKVLISCSDICLKMAFDLNLHNVAGEKDLFIRIQQHNKMSCSSPII